MAGDASGTASENSASPGVPRPHSQLALYRRYRPATFAEVRGQEHVTEPLRQALRNDRIHHAYLFSGPRGCGKTSSARILARSLNCVQGPTPDPCGVCDSCVALAPAGPGSIDVIEIDAASHGGVDDARDLRERAFYAPVSGRFKVYIIDEAHMVTREGFNALLKLVEEPPPHLKFVFATTEPEKVIATIRSRTHHYPFRLVPPTVLRSLLEEILATEGVSYQPQMLPLVVRAGAGSVRDSLSVLDQLLAGAGEEGLTYERTVALLGYTDDSLLDEMVDALAAGDGAAAFGTVDRLVQGGHDPRRFAADLLDRLRDLIILAAVPGAGQTGLLDAPADRLEKMADQAGRFGQAEIARSAEILSEGLIQMRGTTSPRLLLELMCAQVLLPGASTGEKALLTRLERLERRLDGATLTDAPSPRAQAGAAPASTGPASTAQASTAQASTAQASRPAAGERPAPGGAGTTPPGRPAADERPATARQAPGVQDIEIPEQAPSAVAAERPVARQQTVAAADHAAPPSRPAASAQTGPIDADLLRQRWPDILDAVRQERKVAWLLLNPASVDSLESGVLTIAFPREGEAKGFSTSGHDQVLTEVLNRMLGVSVRVRGIVGGPGGSARPAPVARPGEGDREPDAQRGDYAEAGRSSGPGSPATAASRVDETAGGSQETAAPAASEVSPPRAGETPGRRPAGGAGRPQAQAADPGVEEWPDDAGEPGGGTPMPTGMELIQRELGGKVIDEFEEP